LTADTPHPSGAEIVIEKVPPRTPAIYLIPQEPGLSRLRRFTTQPDDTLLVLGPRRPVPVNASLANSNEAFTICTSVGFRHEQVDDYVAAATNLGPDVFIGPADMVYAASRSVKRVEKMNNRSATWMERLFAAASQSPSFPSVFLPVLPVPVEQQRMYLVDMVEFRPQIAGLAVYDPVAVPDLPEAFSALPRLSLSPPSSPHDILDHIALGIDLFTVPFIAAASDAGIALSFSFPPPSPPQSTEQAPLGADLSLPSFASELSPIDANCKCYACANNSQAYLQHLLSAKEMVGWVLLQVHNHAIMDAFFNGIRTSIAAGSFEEDRTAFAAYYGPGLPEKTGAGPR
jgi:queuine tRNA-ribosyltransferase subunit QTRTD1